MTHSNSQKSPFPKLPKKLHHIPNEKKIWSGHPTDPHYPIHCHPIFFSIVIQKKTINYPKNNCWISRKRDEDEKKRESFFSPLCPITHFATHWFKCPIVLRLAKKRKDGNKVVKLEWIKQASFLFLFIVCLFCRLRMSLLRMANRKDGEEDGGRSSSLVGFLIDLENCWIFLWKLGWFLYGYSLRWFWGYALSWSLATSKSQTHLKLGKVSPRRSYTHDGF